MGKNQKPFKPNYNDPKGLGEVKKRLEDLPVRGVLHGAWAVQGSGVAGRLVGGVKGVVDKGKVGVAAPQLPKTIQKVSRGQAERVAEAVGGKLIELPRDKGFKIEITSNTKNPKVIRLMNKGSGGRENAYFRISKNEYGSYTKKGDFSSCAESTHFDINPNTLTEDILAILRNAKK